MSKYFLNNESSQDLRDRQKDADYDLIENPDYYHEVNEALAKATERESLDSVKIHRSQSVAMNLTGDEYLTQDLITRQKQDPRYWDTTKRDPAFCAAISKGVEELGRAKQAKLDELKLQDSMAMGRRALLGGNY